MIARPRGVAALTAALAASLAPYALLSRYAHPNVDDFTFAVDTTRDGYWQAVRDVYVHWTGRFSSNLLALGGPAVWGGITAYHLAAAAMVVTTVIACYIVVRATSRGAWTRGQAAAAGLALAALDLHGLPGLGETIYWYTGAVTYQVSAVLLALLVAVAIRADGSSLRLAAAAVVAIATVGMNEVSMLYVLAGCALWWASTSTVGGRRSAAAVGVIALIASAAVVLAPGTAYRESLYPVRHDLVRSVAMTAAQTVRFAGEWIGDGALLLASVLYLPWGATLAKSERFRGVTRGQALGLAGMLVAAIPIAVFPPYWATGILGQHRTVSVAYQVFLLLWFATLTAWIAQRWVPAGELPAPLRVALIPLLLIALAATGNGRRVIADFAARRPQTFDAEMTARYAALRACSSASVSTCVIPRLSAAPDSFFVLDVGPDSADWVNAAYEVYFHVERVVAAPKP